MNFLEEMNLKFSNCKSNEILKGKIKEVKILRWKSKYFIW